MAIPPDAKHVLIFGQASHLDWDWLNWFPTNVNNIPRSQISYWSTEVQPTDVIFTQATNYLSNANYGYSVCEMGFLRRFWIDHPDVFAKMTKSPGTFHIVGGGITSPDNLLPHGEGFIRDYLVGVSWLKSVNVTWSGKVWLPDDFGHDSQLPVMLQALGVTGVSFGRVPGACNQGRDPEPSGSVSAHHVLLDRTNGGLDFWWQANDGSESFAYYMPDGYCGADGLFDSSCLSSSPEQMANCQCSSTPNVDARIKAYYGVREPLHTTPYIYQAVGCDFRVPLQNLVTTLDQWNTNNYPSTGVYAVSSTFSNYVDLVRAYLQKNGDTLNKRNFHGSTPKTTFKPTPYWMGFYTSRVSNKQLHYATCKALLGAETFLLAASGLRVSTPVTNTAIKGVWNLTAPTTHHDFITGTATDYVYQGEQLVILNNVAQESRSLKQNAVNSIATALNTNTNNNPYIVVFNQNGFNVTSTPVLLKKDDLTADNYEELSKLQNVQKTYNGDLLSLLSAPSLGYEAHSASSLQNIPFEPANGYQLPDATLVLENAYLSATIDSAAYWAISSLVDKRNGQTVLSKGNNFIFRNDNGNIYRYGYEEGCGFNNWNPTVTAGSGSITEKGPLRTVAVTSFSVATSSWTKTYNLVYTLYATEPFLRIDLTGSAADYTAVTVSFTFGSAISTYHHGTPYHWDTKAPFPYGLQNDFKITMEATHDFIIPLANGNALGAIYHNATPAWGVDGNSVIGVLLRNSPSDCAGKGAAGHDAGTYTVSYAVRVPTSLGGPETGQPIKEARAFNTPAVGVSVPKASFNSLPASYSLATVTSPSSAIITAAKPGEYDGNSAVFRVYNPSNSAQNVQVKLANTFASSLKARLVTALEEPVTGDISYTGGVASYRQPVALTSFQLTN
jgi:alpha-mannosidase